MIILRIPEATPSANKYLWCHWSVKAKLRKRWGWLVRIARLETVAVAFATIHPAKVTIDRYGKRKLDHDNFVAGAKGLVDALVAETLIPGDSTDEVEITYRQHKCTDEHTIVSIE